MPELPEVETVKNGLLEHVRQAVIERVEVRFWQLRSPVPPNIAEAMGGARIDDITRRSKYLLWQLSNQQMMISHLGMSGRYHLYDKPPENYRKHEHILWFLRDGRVLAYEDARRFGVIDVCGKAQLAEHPLLRHLGCEPLGDDFTADYLQKALRGRRMAIKPVLMDAQLVVGVGNIYASEACFRARIHPATPACELAGDGARCAALRDAVQGVLREAIASGGSSLRDFWHVDGGGGYFQHRFFVYGRAGKPCRICEQPIEASKQAGRSSFFCPSCQR